MSHGVGVQGGQLGWRGLVGLRAAPGVFLGSRLLCVLAGLAGSRPTGRVPGPPVYEGQTETSLGRGRDRPVGLVEMQCPEPGPVERSEQLEKGSGGVVEAPP